MLDQPKKKKIENPECIALQIWVFLIAAEREDTTAKEHIFYPISEVSTVGYCRIPTKTNLKGEGNEIDAE